MKIREFILKKLNVRPEIVDELLSLGHPFFMKEGQRLLQKGEVSKRVYFIESGIVREYEDLIDNPKKDDEDTTWILGAGEWIYNVESYQTGKPSEVYIQALNTTSGMYFNRKDLDELVQKSHEWSLIQNKIYRHYFVRQERRNKLHRTKDGQDRLNLFSRQHPELDGKVKLKYVASYLNITQSQLSRLRAR